MGAMDHPVTRISTKGQVILPKSVRDHRKWGAGTKLIVEETADGVLLRAAPLFKPTTVMKSPGCSSMMARLKRLRIWMPQ